MKNHQAPIVFVGDGAVAYKELIQSEFTNSLFTENNKLSSYSLGLAGLATYKKGIEIKTLYLFGSVNSWLVKK